MQAKVEVVDKSVKQSKVQTIYQVVFLFFCFMHLKDAGQVQHPGQLPVQVLLA